MGKKRIITKSGGDAKRPDRPAQRGGEETLTLEKGVEIKIPKKKVKRQIAKGNAYINASFNNTIVTFTDEKGGVLVWASAGNLGFKGTRKSTPFAATLVGRAAAEKARRFGFSEAMVYVKGVGPGREAAVRGIFSGGVDIAGIIDAIPSKHGGVKAPKPRRV